MLDRVARDREFQEELRKIASSRSYNKADADNAVQAAFAKATELDATSATTFRSVKQAKCWLRGAARRYALSAGRETAKVRAADSRRSKQRATRATPEGALLGSESRRNNELGKRRAVLHAALRNVPEECLRILEEESNRSRLASNTWRSRVLRARRAIIRCLKDWGISDAHFLSMDPANDNDTADVENPDDDG